MKCACTTLSSVACSGLKVFYTLSHKRQDFRGKSNFIEHKMRVVYRLNKLCVKYSSLPEELSEIDQKCMSVFM